MTERLEQYDRTAQQFVPTDRFLVVSFADVLQGNIEAPEDQAIFMNVCLYDIERTMIATLHNAGERYPGSWIRVFGALSTLDAIYQANTGVNLVLETTLNEVTPHFLATALKQGCAGAVVSEIPGAAVHQFPDAQFFRLSSTATMS